jgi:hypothetical protein
MRGDYWVYMRVGLDKGRIGDLRDVYEIVGEGMVRCDVEAGHGGRGREGNE